MNASEAGEVALQRTDLFIGRTMNWLYDHLRFLPRYSPIVFCDTLANRSEFSELEAWSRKPGGLTRRIWRRLAGDRLYPRDSWRIKRLRPCILHSHFGYVAVGDQVLREILDAPWVMSFYGADVYALGRKPEWREPYAHLFAHAAKVLALGPSMASHLAELGCCLEKLRVHPLGVDTDGLPSAQRTLEPGEPLKRS